MYEGVGSNGGKYKAAIQRRMGKDMPTPGNLVDARIRLKNKTANDKSIRHGSTKWWV